MKIKPLEPSSRTFLIRVLPGLLLTAAFALYGAEQTPEAPAVPPAKAVSIAVSRNMPVAGETVTVQRLAPEAATCEITDPQGDADASLRCTGEDNVAPGALRAAPAPLRR